MVFASQPSKAQLPTVQSHELPEQIADTPHDEKTATANETRRSEVRICRCSTSALPAPTGRLATDASRGCHAQARSGCPLVGTAPQKKRPGDLSITGPNSLREAKSYFFSSSFFSSTLAEPASSFSMMPLYTEGSCAITVSGLFAKVSFDTM